ncbi:penicillin-binding transpeptidase domain-containing protein [Virgibacillus proomii]|uniref:penicillin-binding transpeptidase domain-containing protein n=1 Tax=Virgibacillus proomii TaxID=84407 RepID=UPI000987A737
MSSPSYDPNAFVLGLTDEQWAEWSEDPQKPLLNRFTNLYAPGSVFKTLTAAVGRKSGIMDPNKGQTYRRIEVDKGWIMGRLLCYKSQ